MERYWRKGESGRGRGRGWSHHHTTLFTFSHFSCAHFVDRNQPAARKSCHSSRLHVTLDAFTVNQLSWSVIRRMRTIHEQLLRKPEKTFIDETVASPLRDLSQQFKILKRIVENAVLSHEEPCATNASLTSSNMERTSSLVTEGLSRRFLCLETSLQDVNAFVKTTSESVINLQKEVSPNSFMLFDRSLPFNVDIAI